MPALVWCAMTSPKKVAANRINGRKSRGPRTSAGKARASRNARRHGLAAFSSKDDPAMAEQIEQMVDAICAGDDDPLLRQQAGMIAENQLWLSCVKAEKVALIERLRDPNSICPGKTITQRSTGKIADAPFRYCRFPTDDDRRPDAKDNRCGPRPRARAHPARARSRLAAAVVEGISEDAERDEYEALREGICDLGACSAMSAGHGRDASGLFARLWRSNRRIMIAWSRLDPKP